MAGSSSLPQATHIQGVVPLKTNRPPGRSTRATSGTVSNGSANPMTPLLEDQVETLIGERDPLTVRLHDGESNARLRHLGQAVTQLGRGEVEARDARPPHRHPDAELARAAAVLQHVEVANVPERADVILRDVRHPPRQPVPSIELLRVAFLIRLALAFPVGAVAPDVLGRAGHDASIQPPVTPGAGGDQPCCDRQRDLRRLPPEVETERRSNKYMTLFFIMNSFQNRSQVTFFKIYCFLSYLSLSINTNIFLYTFFLD